jgi:hypothetical protein
MNDNFRFLNTCDNSKNVKLHCEFIRNDSEVKRPSRVNTRDIHPERCPGVYRLWRKGNAKDMRSKLFEEERSGEIRVARVRRRRRRSRVRSRMT